MNGFHEARRLELAAIKLALKTLTLPATVLLRRGDRHLLWRLFETCFGSQRPFVYPEVSLGECIGPDTHVDVVEVPGETFNVTEYELFVLAAITAATEPEVIFEFGTADGRTTLNLARNSPGQARVFTINLPLQDDPGHSQDVPVGQRFRETAAAKKITQLWGNTRDFDFSRYEGACHVVFIDADHSEEGVLADSLTALRLVDGNAVILWHDALRYGVQSALPRLAREKQLPIRLISGTNLACLFFENGAPAVPNRGLARCVHA